MKAQMPDVVCLQELNGYSAEKLAADAAFWGHDHSELLKTDGFPTGITSRYPIHHVERLRDGFHHGLLRCQIEGVWFYVIHFHPSNFARRIEEAALLNQDVVKLPEQNPRIVLAGDFNGFSPADKAHYDQDTHLVPFFRGLIRRTKMRETSTTVISTTADCRRSWTSSTSTSLIVCGNRGLRSLEPFLQSLSAMKIMEQIDALTTSLSHPICRSPSFRHPFSETM